ncbi:MAG: L-lactate dehydrogenase [Anaerolineae bacterium]|jgi:L-lactate dehydrogenase
MEIKDWPPHVSQSRRVAVVGAGNVGATFAYALVLNGLVGEIVLIDVDRERAEGEAMDISHAVPLSNPVRVWAGEYSDCAGADLVVVAAGTAQRPGENRLDLAKRNVDVFGDVIPRVTACNETGILLVATNPVDVLSYAAWKLSGFPAGRVIGSGTVLDTSRFRYLLSQHLDVDPRNVHAYVVGEHGDSEVPVWSLASVAGMRLDEYCRRERCDMGDEARARISRAVRDAAYEVIERKGATYYAVAVALVRIVESLLRDQRTVLSVSSLVPGYYGIENVYLSLPAVIGSGGVERVVDLALASPEELALRNSAAVLRDVLAELSLPD